MKWDRSKIYGYTTEYVLENGYPDDNETMLDGIEGDTLTIEEIRRMFPEQTVLLRNITYDGKKHENNIISADVVKYHCTRTAAHMAANKDTDYVFSNYSGLCNLFISVL